MMTPDFTDELLSFVDLSTLDERLGSSRIISKQYQSTLFLSPETENTASWGQCSFIEVDRDANGRLSHVIFATQSIQESKIKELKAKQKLKAANEELTALLAAEKQHTAIIGSLSSVFFALYYIDLEKITFQEVISLDSLRSISGVNALLTDLQT
ncbi:MAG: hypothetical protein MRZ45_10760 [Blautia sp.]|nr:hypothetical protein [Blautia sp.]MDY4515208.1 hypothetical protein [Lachnospiraceae bacterium]